ncbi:MAG: glutaredoxin family protein [Methylophilaceae bacterium]
MKKIIFVLVAFFLFQQFYPTKTVEVNAIKHENVILYATAWCGYCKKMRGFLAENNINYIEYDVEKSEEGRKQHEALNARGVPVLDIKGTIIYGYDLNNTKHVLQTLHLM